MRLLHQVRSAFRISNVEEQMENPEPLLSILGHGMGP